MFTSVDPWLASLRSSFAGLTLSSSQHQQKKKKEMDGIAQDLEDAERNWEWIQAVLADAEEWQIDDGSVREWLRDLRRLAYQIEDLRDVYAYEVVAREVQASKKAPSSSGDASTSKMRKVEVRSPSLSPLLDDSFRKQIAVDLGKIKKEFDAMAKRREALHLKESDGRKHSSNDINSRREATGHLSVAPVCHGRDGDLQQLRDLLIADHGDGRMNFEVIAVIGMGGMGKTTLAQHVLKDPRVVENFVKIGWVHVSETFDVIRLTKDAIESFSEQECGLSGLSALQVKITELIKEKKVLLVADDVWNTKQIGWESFVTPFRDGAGKGSKILVTTRFRDVADETRAVKSIELKRLSEEHGWSLLKENAFTHRSDDVDNAEELEALHLKESDGRKHSSNDSNSRREATGHLSVAPVCHGRDGDLQQLRDLLIADHGDGRMNCEVIALIGMGGMGKTTLAQHILKDSQVAGYFDKIGWVHVSETFDVIRLTKAVIQSFAGRESGLSELSPLQVKITKLIKKKKVLLVADDVWNTEQIGWESFVIPFLYGAEKGSKILVTTRLPEVAIKTRAVKSIELKRLSEEHGWSLLKEHADVDNAEELEIIGKGIVAKCGGLPLSIKLLGSLLRYKKNDEDEWRNVMESNLLDLREGSEAKEKILESLYLSYLHLSPQLKSCFKCCSKYPNDEIWSKDLKHSWIAYDLVKDEKEASRCLYELQSRSFLEIYKERDDESFEMHDHIYDLAQYVQGEEHLNIQYDGVPFPEEVGMTHFSGARNATITFHDVLHVYDNSCCHIDTTQANVRTLTFSYDGKLRIQLSLGKYLRELTIQTSCVELTSCDDGFQDQLKCLRLLYLDRVEWSSIPLWVFRLYNLRYLSVEAPDLECLSDSVCDLRNLRGLSIRSYRIRYLPEAISRLTNLQELDLSESLNFEYLPETISELVNLQELNLSSCEDFEGLPEGIIHLTNLRILDLDYTRISFMPKGLGALTELRHLTYYVADSTKGAGLAELKNMRYLECLRIQNLCDIVKEEDASQAELEKKKHLRRLLLSWYIGIEEKIAHDHEEQVLKRLRPHQNLEELVIENYKGFELPSWMGHESFTKLVTLTFYNINYCISLSPVDKLPSLEKLILVSLDSLKAVVPEHNGGHVDSDSMDSATEQRLSFPMLKDLSIVGCTSIELLPLRKLTSLEDVFVAGCENLEHIEPPYHSPLRQIFIRWCPRFHFSPDPHFPKPSWKLIVQNDTDDDTDTDDDMATFHSPESD